MMNDEFRMKSEIRNPKSNREPVEVLKVVPLPCPGPDFSDHIKQILTLVAENFGVPTVLLDASERKEE
jgi:hypothetical protein